MEIDFVRRMILLEDKIIDLTRIENTILELLYYNKGKTITYGDITKKIYNIDNDEGLYTTVRKHVCNLRKKVKNYINISTVNGLGYRIEEE